MKELIIKVPALQHATFLKSYLLNRYFPRILQNKFSRTLHDGYFSVNEYKRHIHSAVNNPRGENC